MGTTEGLFESADGCAWSGNASLSGLTVLSIAVDGDRVWVGSEAGSRPSGLLVSEDGVSYEPTALFGEQVRVNGVRVSGDAVWATVWDGAESTWTLRVGEGVDGTFAVHPLTADGPMRLLTADEDAAVVAVRRGDGWLVAEATRDDVAAEHPIADEPVAAAFPQGLHVVTAGDTLLDVPNDTVVGEDVHCITDEGWFCTSTDSSNTALVHLDGRDRVVWADVRPADCPADTEGGTLVERWWGTANAAGIGPRVPSDTEPPEDGCCASVAAKRRTPWAILLGLLFFIRRRS